MTILRKLIAPAAMALIASPLAAQEITPEQAEIEAQLIPLVEFRGEEGRRPSLAERQRELGVSSASVAIFRDGKLEWAKAYGEGIDTDTLYQAASLSKAVASAGIVALALERGTSLDADISDELGGLDLDKINPEGLPITLRGLLSHTNGAGVSGFPGYVAGTPIPTTAQIIEGDGPTNTDTVVISSERHGGYKYSGGGYTIAQYWAETVSGEPFPAIMRRYILDPVGMERSLFAALPPEEFPRENVVRAWYRDEAGVEGGWHLYPEHAAASLWSTPKEYAKFALAFLRALEGDASGGIAPAVARELAKPVSENYGLGIGSRQFEGTTVYAHSGSNVGYKSSFIALPDGHSVAVYMTNSENGWPLISDIARKASTVYGWPQQSGVVLTRLPASDSEIAMIAGEYRMANGEGPSIVMEAGPDGELAGRLPNGGTFRLVRIGNMTWIDPEDGQEAKFTYAVDGTVSVQAGDRVFVRQ